MIKRIRLGDVERYFVNRKVRVLLIWEEHHTGRKTKINKSEYHSVPTGAPKPKIVLEMRTLSTLFVREGGKERE